VCRFLARVTASAKACGPIRCHNSGGFRAIGAGAERKSMSSCRRVGHISGTSIARASPLNAGTKEQVGAPLLARFEKWPIRASRRTRPWAGGPILGQHTKSGALGLVIFEIWAPRALAPVGFAPQNYAKKPGCTQFQQPKFRLQCMPCQLDKIQP
jgi:hypothetical protein